MGILYLVATPIGNLEDLSPRAVRTLREVRLIAAEDTRVTRKLLTHFDLHTPLTSYFEHNKLNKLDTILAALPLTTRATSWSKPPSLPGILSVPSPGLPPRWPPSLPPACPPMPSCISVTCRADHPT
jgi:hypothetical protein